MPVTHYVNSPTITFYKQSGCHYEDAQETWDPSAEELRSLAMRKACVLMPFHFPSHRSAEENLPTPFL